MCSKAIYRRSGVVLNDVNNSLKPAAAAAAAGSWQRASVSTGN